MMIYGVRANQRPHGTVLTRPAIAEAMLDLLGYTAKHNLSQFSVLDPCGGEGVFICACIERLAASANQHGFSFAEAYAQLKVVELDPQMVSHLHQNIQQTLRKLGKLAAVNDWQQIIHAGDFLEYPGPQVDVVIGNPPYVRYEQLSAELKACYKKRFSTFRHRSDLYIAFYQKGLELLKPEGRLSFICANRWLKNQYGQSLRALIAQAYTLDWNLNLEQVEAFDESVGAYASITQIRKGKGTNANERKIKHLYELTELSAAGSTDTSSTSHPTAVFPLELIESQGFAIGIGVATGADKILIGKELHQHLEAECLLPLVMGKDVQGQQLSWSGYYLFNPWDQQGRLRNLDQFPQAKAYLERHYQLLSQRYIARKNPQRWFQLIDKIKPALQASPKILLADISRNHWVTIDKGQYYPHHNLYWITGPDLRSLKLLACFLMSSFVRDQLHQLSPLMNGGYARWQSQHLRKLKVPVLRVLPPDLQQQLVLAYDQYDLNTIQTLTESALNSPPDSNSTETLQPYHDLPLFALAAQS